MIPIFNVVVDLLSCISIFREKYSEIEMAYNDAAWSLCMISWYVRNIDKTQLLICELKKNLTKHNFDFISYLYRIGRYFSANMFSLNFLMIGIDTFPASIDMAHRFCLLRQE